MRDRVEITNNNNSIVNYRSELRNVSQIIGGLDKGSVHDRVELEKLVSALFSEIENLPEEQAAEGKTLARKAVQLVEDIQEGADRGTVVGMLDVVFQVTKKAFSNAPKILENVEAIGKLVEKII